LENNSSRQRANAEEEDPGTCLASHDKEMVNYLLPLNISHVKVFAFNKTSTESSKFTNYIPKVVNVQIDCLQFLQQSLKFENCKFEPSKLRLTFVLLS
jgi:hypothetical protein